MNRRAPQKLWTAILHLHAARWSVLGLAALLFALPVGAMIAAAPVHACTDSDDVNTLCSNEQAFVNDLAKVGVTPTKTPRIMVNQGQQLCGQIGSGVPRDVVIQKVYGGAAMRLDQAQAIVAAAINHLCFTSSAPGPGSGGSGVSRPAPTTSGEWWDTPSQGQAVCSIAKVESRDWAVNYGIGDFNGTAEGARFVDALIAKYCPQYAD